MGLLLENGKLHYFKMDWLRSKFTLRSPKSEKRVATTAGENWKQIVWTKLKADGNDWELLLSLPYETVLEILFLVSSTTTKKNFGF
jgi:hypothetical protein